MTDFDNITVPTSLGALLAEEWTINPYSTLPSFLEMIMIQEGQMSFYKAIGYGLNVVQNSLLDYSRQHPYVATGSHTSRLSVLLEKVLVRLEELQQRVCQSLTHILRKYEPEIKFLLVYLLEHQILNRTSSLLSESMYGLRRSRISRTRADDLSRGKLSDLSQTDKTRLALLTALLTYLDERVHTIYNHWKRLYAVSPKWKQFAVKAYPYIRLAMYGTRSFTHWRFLLGRSPFFDPLSLLLGQVVRRTTQEDTKQTTNASPDAIISSGDATTPSQSQQVLAVKVLSAILAISWITQIRYEWKKSRNAKRRIESEKPLVPPPPPLTLARNKGSYVASDLCPICRRPRRRPTASTSGNVFCYDCLFEHISKHGTCPLTGMPCPQSKMVPLYEPRGT